MHSTTEEFDLFTSFNFFYGIFFHHYYYFFVLLFDFHFFFAYHCAEIGINRNILEITFLFVYDETSEGGYSQISGCNFESLRWIILIYIYNDFFSLFLFRLKLPSSKQLICSLSEAIKGGQKKKKNITHKHICVLFIFSFS